MRAKGAGPFLVGLGALLWATDALFRVPAVQRLDPTFLVFAEHAAALAILLPVMLLFFRKNLFSLRRREWLALLIIGAAGSGLATLFFTASFRYLNPSVTILLQKFQPLLVVLTAYLFLGERPERNYFLWAPIALLAAITLTFPDLNFRSLLEGVDPRSKGVVLALSAAAIWAISTTLGKAVLRGKGVWVTTFWRYAFGLGALSALLFVEGNSPNSSWLVLRNSPSLSLAVLYMGLVPGLLAILVYYAGLARTAASVATFLELLFPVAAVLLNTLFLKNSALQPLQLVAAAVLLVSVYKVSRSH